MERMLAQEMNRGQIQLQSTRLTSLRLENTRLCAQVLNLCLLFLCLRFICLDHFPVLSVSVSKIYFQAALNTSRLTFWISRLSRSIVSPR